MTLKEKLYKILFKDQPEYNRKWNEKKIDQILSLPPRELDEGKLSKAICNWEANASLYRQVLTDKTLARYLICEHKEGKLFKEE